MTADASSRRRLLLGLAAACTMVPSRAGTVLRVGPGRPLRRLADAARVAGNGSVIEVDAGDYVADVAVWEQDALTLRGIGGPVRLLADGAHAQGKAIWVVRGGRVTVENIEFHGARVPDRNGAGIRLEQGHLTVRQCRFLDSETGILTSNGAGIELEVEGSEFGRLGAGDGQSHGLYVGAIARFTLRGCHVHHANVGHLVKSRARWNRIEYNRLTDEAGGRASYELEFPNGGIAEVVGNLVQQGEGTHNRVMVSFGAEGTRWPRNQIGLAHNTFVNEAGPAGTFVRVAAGTTVVTRNNLLVGPGRLELPADGDTAGDRRLAAALLSDLGAGDYRVTAAGRAALNDRALAATAPGMTPGAQYEHPRSTRPLAGPPQLPGALQHEP